MRILVSVALLVSLGVMVGASSPPQARACTGPSIEFRDALRFSEGPIYAGRIVHVLRPGAGPAKLTIDVDLVVRAPAARTVTDVIPPFGCDAILKGQWGYIVGDVRDAQYGEGVSTFFFAIDDSVARPALRAVRLPDTGTAIEGPSQARSTGVLALVLAVALTASVAMYGLLRVRPTQERPAGDTGRSTGPRPPSRS